MISGFGSPGDKWQVVVGSESWTLNPRSYILRPMKKPIPVSLGLRVKTGRAIAVLLRGPAAAPTVVKRGELMLADSNEPDTWQPYHVVMDLPWDEAEQAVQKTARIIGMAGSKAISEWAREARTSGFTISAVGIVAGSLQDPAKIGSPHIRAHAAEGRLYREALERGADKLKLFRRCFAEEKLYETAAAELGLSVARLKERVSEFGAPVGRPWRADEKAAAAAAWAVLGRK